MSVSKTIKQLMIEKDVKVGQLAKLIGLEPRQLSSKLYKDRFSVEEVCQILKALGYDINVVDRETGDIHLSL